MVHECISTYEKVVIQIHIYHKYSHILELLMCNLIITMNCWTKFNNFKFKKYIIEFNYTRVTYYSLLIYISTLCQINNYVLLILIRGRVNVITFQTFIVIIWTLVRVICNHSWSNNNRNPRKVGGWIDSLIKTRAHNPKNSSIVSFFVTHLLWGSF